MKKQLTKKDAVKAFKVFNPDWTCNKFQFEVGKTFKHEGRVQICNSGFHACEQIEHCFYCYSFDPKNKVAEVLIWGEVDSKDGDSKVCGSQITIVREISWPEVLVLANHGKDNTGHSNSGDRNSGDRNSGDRNSGSWNSGDRNSGDSNSGYRNSGAFCTDANPEVWLFDQPSGILVKDWESHPAMNLIARHLETHIWIYGNSMTDAEKESYPKWETTDGYLKAISLKEAWANMWPNLNDASRKVFLDLPNFDQSKFEIITGIKVEQK